MNSKFKSIPSETVDAGQKSEGKRQQPAASSQQPAAGTQERGDAEIALIQNSKFKIQNSPTLHAPRSTLRPAHQLCQWMQQCRQMTLDLFTGIDYETLSYQAHPEFSPIGWHLGHIAYTESLWLLEKCAGLPPQFPHYRRLFAADGLPKAERVYLPTLTEIQQYLSAVRTQVFDYLETAPLDQQERLWRWLLQHESQHAETIALVLELQRHQVVGGRCQVVGEDAEKEGRVQKAKKTRRHGDTGTRSIQFKPQTSNLKPQTSNLSLPHSPLICIPAGYFDCGNDSSDALDNERPVHRVYLDTYWIDRDPVTCRQYRVFMEAGGYKDSRWWSPEGWQWLQVAQISQPLYWQDEPGWEHHPVCGVSWYEADAYARFAGKRLPTEAEWEKAASWNPVVKQRQTYPWGEVEPADHLCNHGHAVGHPTPVDAYPAGNSPYGCGDMLGNVWEWTASWFDGYDGFTSYPYRGYSQAYFDGNHRVLKGGSWATFSWALRSAFRNWYYPHVREILAGFRCVRDEE